MAATTEEFCGLGVTGLLMNLQLETGYESWTKEAHACPLLRAVRRWTDESICNCCISLARGFAAYMPAPLIGPKTKATANTNKGMQDFPRHHIVISPGGGPGKKLSQTQTMAERVIGRRNPVEATLRASKLIRATNTFMCHPPFALTTCAAPCGMSRD
jgi:hypothetical protein